MATQPKPFALGPGEAAVSTSAWLAGADRTVGFAAGVLPKEKLNKALRQAGTPGAALMQAVSDRYGRSILDDGNFATLVALLSKTLLGGALTISGFGADPTGAADASAAVTLAFSAGAANGLAVEVDGRFRLTSGVEAPHHLKLVGVSQTSDYTSGGRAHSCFIKDFTGTVPAIWAKGDDCIFQDFQVDATSTAGGDGVLVTGTRFYGQNVTVSNQGASGWRLGLEGGYNTNAWMLLNCRGIHNTLHGLWVHDPSIVGDTSTDVNGGTLLGGTYDVNGGDGIRADASSWNVYLGFIAQTNVGAGFRFTKDCRGSFANPGDMEGNGINGVFDPDTITNVAIGSFYNGSQTWFDNSGKPGANLVTQYVHDTERMATNAILVTDAFVQRRKVIVQASTMTPDAALGSMHEITFTTNAAWTLANPIHGPVQTVDTQTLMIQFRNTTGAVIGSSTFGTGYKLAGAFVPPAANSSRTYTFQSRGPNVREEVSRTGDVPIT